MITSIFSSHIGGGSSDAAGFAPSAGRRRRRCRHGRRRHPPGSRRASSTSRRGWGARTRWAEHGGEAAEEVRHRGVPRGMRRRPPAATGPPRPPSPPPPPSRWTLLLASLPLLVLGWKWMDASIDRSISSRVGELISWFFVLFSWEAFALLQWCESAVQPGGGVIYKKGKGEREKKKGGKNFVTACMDLWIK